MTKLRNTRLKQHYKYWRTTVGRYHDDWLPSYDRLLTAAFYRRVARRRPR